MSTVLRPGQRPEPRAAAPSPRGAPVSAAPSAPPDAPDAAPNDTSDRVTPADPPRALPAHALREAVVVAALASDPDGLTASDAARRLLADGPNALPRPAGPGALALLARQLVSPLVLVLLGAGALALALGRVTDGGVVLAVVVLNALVGFVQEWRAGREIAALDALVPERVVALRDGARVSVDASALVRGDVVLLEAGDRVPADLRLLEVRGLAVDEASLTGESVPAVKLCEPVPAGVPLADRRNMAYAGTIVAAGAGRGIVVATGARTELGRVATLVAGADPGETPLVRALGRVARTLTVAILAVAVALGGVAWARGFPAADALLAAITLAVAAIPEGLPAIVTIALAVGVRRMARRGAVVRRLPAVETLGGTTVICSDKTGTLTANAMRVEALWCPAMCDARADDGADARVVDPHGDHATEARTARGPAPAPDGGPRLLRAAALASEAHLASPDTDGAPRAEGDPTEVALVLGAAAAGLDVRAERARWPRLDALPFDAATRYMATLHAPRVTPARGAGDADDRATARRVVLLKGAPEAVLPRCDASPEADRDAAEREVARLAAEGMRVLAVAARPARWAEADGGGRLAHETLGGDFALLGLVGLLDPPRPEARDAVAACRAAGVRVVMITGDHPATALAIARRLGIAPGASGGERAPNGDGTPAPVRTGAELDACDDAAFAEAARTVPVFARVAPEQKLRLVRALQAQGEVVAMTGDGVNDAPALRQAAIGVAMGRAGTAAAREAADVVLTDDHFATIAAAVREGRRVYDNLVKALAFVLPTNLALALVLLVGVVALPVTDGVPLLPMTPTQLLWINLVATVTLALPLAFEAPEPDVMARPPRAPDASPLDRFVRVRTVVVALAMAGAAVLLFALELMAAGAGGVLTGAQAPSAPGVPAAIARAQTAAVTAVVLMQAVYLLLCRSLTRPARAVGWWSNPLAYAGIAALLLLQLAFVHAAPLQRVFGTAPLDATVWAHALLAALPVVPLVSLEKWWRRRRHAARRHAAPGAASPSP